MREGENVPLHLFLVFYPPGGIMSSFLMGCYDPDTKKWCTVTKCSGGYDDAMLARLQKELDVIKISKVGEDPVKEPPQPETMS